MDISPDFVPSSLDEAVKCLLDQITSEDIKFIKTNSTPYWIHFSFGRRMRNDWSLWDRETVLVKWFEKEFGITHADDISGMITDALWKEIRGEPRRDSENAKKYLEYWKKMEEFEKSGKTTMQFKIDKDGNLEIL